MTRLDKVVWIVIAALIAAGAFTVAVGDRVGLSILAVNVGGSEITTDAVGQAPVSAAIRLTFSESVGVEAAKAAFSITPEVEGSIEVSGQQLTFTPRIGFQPRTRYTVTVAQGLTGESGRRALVDFTAAFDIRAPIVVYLAPALRDENNVPTNLYRVDPVRPMQPEQLTNSRLGIVNFAPSPDGTTIAYAEQNQSGTIDLFALNLQTRSVRRLTECIAAHCQSPVWSPDGTKIAYERIETNQQIAALDEGAPRTWILNVRDLSAAPLFEESESLGGTPRWSRDGNKIAVYDRDLGAIVVLHLDTGDREAIKTLEGIAGDYAFAPDSGSLTFPQLFNVERAFYTELAVADFTARTIAPLTDDEIPVSDYAPAWNPGDDTLTIARRYLDGRDGAAAQIYRYDPRDKSVKPLIIDRDYYHGALSYDPIGAQLVMMRRSEREMNPKPGIWVYDHSLKNIWQVAENGYLPAWLP